MNCHLGCNESLETTLVMCVNNKNHPNRNMVVLTSLFVSYDVLLVSLFRLSLRYLQLKMTFYPMHLKGQLILVHNRAWKVQPY